MSSGVQEYRGKNIVIHFDGQKCIHSRNCVLGRPDVFVPNAPDPWIQPDGAAAEEVAAVARACPSGAITYERLDGTAQESARARAPRLERRHGDRGPPVHAAGDPLSLRGLQEQAVL